MTFNPTSLIERAATLSIKNNNLPNSNKLVESLLKAEKIAKKNKDTGSFSDLIGTWNLRFITGTKKSRKRAGIALGAGKYIPQLLKIEITYQPDRQQKVNLGRVTNTVRFGFIAFSLSGPVRFIPRRNILAFDFTVMKIKIFGKSIYDGYIKDGAHRESQFYTQKIARQAFFTYFLVQDNFIAARGKGGGLALWVKNQNSSPKQNK